MESDSRENFTKSTSDMENAIQACNQKKKKAIRSNNEQLYYYEFNPTLN